MDEENVSVLCRICISSNSNSTQQMIPIFGDDSLWQKITTLADVKIDADDTLPQQVCVACANSAISACVFKKKCEDADRFFRQQLLLQKVENVDGITDEADKVAAPLDGHTEATSSLTKENNKNDNELVVVNNNSSKKTNKQTDDHGNEADNDDDDDDVDEESSDDSSDESSGSSDSDDDDDDDSKDSDSNQDKEKKAKALKNAEEHHQHELDHENENEHEHDNDEHQRQILAAGMSSLMAAGYGIAEDGEIKCPNGIKAPFDFNSIRLMHEYMQQQLSKINGHHMLDNNGQHSDNEHNEAGEGSESAAGANDEDGLPLIPEIELITPSEDNVAAMAAATSVNGGMSASAAEAYDVGSMAQMRGYQCPSCYQIFEMKNILKAHMLSVHGTAGPVYECNNCKKTYFYKRFLEKHVRRGRCVKKRRNQTRPMQCTDCDVLFPTGHHLGWHKRTGCPSRAAKLPLQQLFKQNVAKTNPYVNNRIGLRKPENAIYLHNRKLLMASNKRKGRTRIKLDAKKIALAKQLILREATTTVIANELNISRTFAWRLRKSLVNGVSLHERVIEPSTLDDVQLNGNEQHLQDQQEQQQQQQQHMLQQQYILQQQQRQLQVNDFPHIKMAGHIKPEKTESDDNDHDTANDVERLGKDAILDESAPHGPLPLLVNNEQNASNSHDDDDDDEDNCPRENGLKENNNLIDSKDALKRTKNSMTGAGGGGINLYSLHHSQEQFLKNMVAHAQRENVIVANGGGVDFHKHAKNGGGLPTLPLLNFPPAVAAAINHLPVNLSIRPIASMQKMETSNYKKLNNMIPSTLSSPDTTQMSSMSGGVKKPRKPNVFIDDEKYAMAKILVAQNASTMEIARALNVSQMTAWKVRDAIVKGLPLSYRNKREREMQAHNATAMLYNRHEDVGSSGGSDGGGSSDNKLLLQQQQQQQQVVQHMQHEHDELQRQKQQQQMQQQHMKLVQRQQQQQRLLYQEQQQQQLLLQQEQQKQQLKLQEQQKHLNNNNNNNNNDNNNKPLTTTTIPTTKLSDQQPPEHLAIGNGGQKRRRLKAAEREMRDKEITREILELIKEDSNIQYWKVSARLAEKGYPISPSSVCQKLKSMGIHRRWKFADKPKPLPMDTEHLKVAAVAAANSAAIHDPLAGNTNGVGVLSDAAVAAAAAAAASNFESAQFHMGGAHFLSAFTR